MRLLMHHVMLSFVVKHQITQVTQSRYSPDLVPRDFWLFPKLKSPLKGKRFQTVDEIWGNLKFMNYLFLELFIQYFLTTVDCT